MTGMYLMEDTDSLVDFMVARGQAREEVQKFLAWGGFRVTMEGERITHQEWFGGESKTITYKLGEEMREEGKFSSGEEVRAGENI